MGLHQPSEERQHHGDRGKDPRMRVLVTGGCGYIGSVLVPKLERAGHVVSIADLMWFWEHQSAASDFREYKDLSGFDAVIHLAAIANDPTGDLDPKLTWETNALGTMQLAATAALDGVKQFIYASSGSVYGVSDQPQVTEETSRLIHSASTTKPRWSPSDAYFRTPTQCQCRLCVLERYADTPRVFASMLSSIGSWLKRLRRAG
jgi:nucleoside-diphosphate-sugar epimerase